MSRYQLLRQLGQGAMGTVWLARRSLGNGDSDLVALKFMAPSVRDRPKARERFRREVQQSIAFHHQHLVKVLDCDEYQGQPVMVMEYVDGLSLAQFMESTRLAAPVVRHFCLVLLDALDYLACRRIVHRDVKPANILISRQGYIKLADFGLLKLLDAPPTEPHFKGTAAYASPEALARQPIDTRTDLYSLGAVLYHLVAGRPRGGAPPCAASQ